MPSALLAESTPLTACSRVCSPIKKVNDERKGPKNNKRKYGDARFVHAAWAVELRQGHHSMPTYSDELIADESPTRQPMRLLSACSLSINPDLANAHPGLKSLNGHKIELKVWQLEQGAGPAALLPCEVTVSRIEPASVLRTNPDSILPVLRPLMCVVADRDRGGKKCAGFDVLENFLTAEDQLAFLKVRTVETQTCQQNQTSTFTRESEEIIALYSSSSKAGREHLGCNDENVLLKPKHLRAAFVNANPGVKSTEGM